MLIAIIPARGGSKGIPRKNLKLLAGKPLIQYTIESAINSKMIDEILLTTDDDEIAELGERLGLPVRYRRPLELGADTTSMFSTVEHALQWFENEAGFLPEVTLLLQPTSPLRRIEDIDACIQEFYRKSATSLVSVHEMNEHPFECVFGDRESAQYLINPPIGVSRRQDYLEKFYYINGAVYIANTINYLFRQSFIELGETIFYEISREHGIDIDTEFDLQVAEALMAAARSDSLT